MIAQPLLKLALTGICIALPLHAALAQQRNCAPRDRVVDRLSAQYGETRQSIGLGSNNAVVETFASTETGTWTITVTTPNGLTCLVASGKSFETVQETAPAKGDDA